MNLINRKNLVIAVAFGFTAFLIIYFEIFYSIPGTILLSDPREVIVTLGAALTGPIGGIIVGFLSSIYDPKSEILLYVIAQHVLGACLFGLFYKKIVYENFRMPFFIIFWSLLIFCYYFVFYIPIFSIIYLFDRTFFETILPGNYPFLEALTFLFKGWIPEFIFTTVFTSIVLIALPERFRKPHWGKDTQSAQMKLNADKKAIHASSLFKNILPIRLILWFLILALIPIYLIGFSIKKDLVKSLLEHEAIFRQSMANGFKQKFIDLTPRESIIFFKESQSALSGDLFIMSKKGKYALVTDKEKEDKDVSIDYSQAVIEKILTMKNGNYIDEENAISFGFASVNSSMHELIIVAVSDKEVVANLATEIKNEAHRKLIFGFIIVSFSLIIIIWFIVKAPLAKFRDVILQFSDGIYHARVPLDEMNDEIKLLASSFNNMAERISAAKENLEKEIFEHKATENQLKESEKRWKFALEGAGDGVWDWNAQTNKVFFSSQWKSMLGYQEDEISDSLNEWSDRIHPDDKEKCLDDVGRYLKGETQTYQNEHRMRCKEGSYKWILDRGKIIEWAEDGKPLRVIGTHTDIDLQKRTIKELELKNVFIQTILDNLPIGLATNEINSGRANYINKKFKEIYGWTEEIIADIPSFFENVYPDPEYRQEIATRIMSDIQSGDPSRMKWNDVKITTEKGEEKYVSAVNIPIIEQNIMVSTVQDVTEQKLSRDKVLEHSKNLSALLEISSMLASTLQLDTILKTLTESIISLLKLDSGAIYLVSREDLYLAATTPTLSPDFPDIFRHALINDHSMIKKAILTGKPLFVYDTKTVELLPAEKKIIETRDFRSLLYIPIISGETTIAILIIGTVSRLRFMTEAEIEICKTLSNISALAIANSKLYEESQKHVIDLKSEMEERSRVEEALKASEERYKSLFNNNHSVMLLIEPDSGEIVDVNPAACKYYGWSRDEMLRKKITEINTLTVEEIFREMEAAKNEKRNRFFFKHRLADGQIRDVEVFSGAVEINSKTLLYSIIHDITDRIIIEKALKDSEDRLNQAIRVSLIGIYDHDHTNNILYYSPQQRMIFGLDMEEEVTLQKYFEAVHPDDRAMIVQAVKKAHNPKGDGLFDVEFRILKTDGTLRWVSTRSQTYFTGKGDKDFPLRTIGAAIDITERKQFEKQLTDALKEKEILLREVHHRVKNNFQVIISLLSLQSDLITDPIILNAFKESRNRIKSMALIHELLYQESNFESIDIKHYVQNLVDYLRRSYADTKSNFIITIDMEDIQIEIDTIIPCGLIINELISNSIKHAFPDGRDGEIHISFKKISTESYCLILRDNGIGIPKNIDRSNLKSLGMMLINTLTKQVNGELYIESSDKGSEFRIIFKAKN